MNILHLKYAAEIARTGSLNKAAKNLYIGQPNLSRAIKDLEASFGITIFERSSTGMKPTTEGAEFLGYAEKLLKQIDEIEAIYRVGAPSKQRFAISAPRSSYIAEAFARFSMRVDRDRPSDFIFTETTAAKAISNIVQGDYRLGIVRYDDIFDKYFKDLLAEKNLTAELIDEFPFLLTVCEGHPLAEKERVVCDDLCPYTELTQEDLFLPPLSQTAIRKEEGPVNVRHRIMVTDRASGLEILSANKQAFMWTAPMPTSQLQRYGLVQKACADRHRIYRDMLIYQKDYHLTRADQMFIVELCESKRRHLH